MKEREIEKHAKSKKANNLNIYALKVETCVSRYEYTIDLNGNSMKNQ